MLQFHPTTSHGIMGIYAIPFQCQSSPGNTAGILATIVRAGGILGDTLRFPWWVDTHWYTWPKHDICYEIDLYFNHHHWSTWDALSINSMVSTSHCIIVQVLEEPRHLRLLRHRMLERLVRNLDVLQARLGQWLLILTPEQCCWVGVGVSFSAFNLRICTFHSTVTT